ncbi:MAG: PAC2 family protein, partial [Deltaproteobacteria bacterium]|nr:PAC2 family protein [Deltaproteobacteria bacterium]
MHENSLQFDFLPEINNPLLVACFSGWGNALDISWGMADFIIRKLDARVFGHIKPDQFYSFDEKRPTVEIKDGILKNLEYPGTLFYVTNSYESSRHIVILKAVEPSLRWSDFSDDILSACEKLGVKTIICIGSKFDNVLHTDNVISAVASDNSLLNTLDTGEIKYANYSGFGGIHSAIGYEAQKRGLDYINLWCHCPKYLQGSTHFGMLCKLGNLISEIGGFKLETDELEITWQEVSRQIQDVIDKNPELKGMIDDLKKEYRKTTDDSQDKHG